MQRLRNDFPIFSRTFNDMPLCYLDSASTSQKPQVVIDAVVKTYTTFNANPGRAIYELAEQATTHYNQARKKVAQFINADDHEIIFVRGATEGINTIATGWAMHHCKTGDQIVLSELEHHSNLLPWQRVAKYTGATLQFIPITHDGSLNYAAVSSIISKRTKFIAITQSSNAIGTSVTLAPIIDAAQRVGARVLIDASQSAPHEPIDVKKIGCDFLVFSGHKMLGPTGSGVLYINAARFDEVQPFTLGGGSVLEVSWHDATLRRAPEKFEAGTVSLAQAVGLAAAIEYMERKVPFDQLRSHEAALCTQLIDGLKKHKKITILGPLDDLRVKGHLVTFVVDGVHPHDVAAFLDRTAGICVRAGNFCAQPLLNKLGYQAAIRASFHCYCTAHEVEQLLYALDQFI